MCKCAYKHCINQDSKTLKRLHQYGFKAKGIKTKTIKICNMCLIICINNLNREDIPIKIDPSKLDMNCLVCDKECCTEFSSLFSFCSMCILAIQTNRLMKISTDLNF